MAKDSEDNAHWNGSASEPLLEATNATRSIWKCRCDGMSPTLLLLLEFLYYFLFGVLVVPDHIANLYWGIIFLVFLYECAKFLRQASSQNTIIEDSEDKLLVDAEEGQMPVVNDEDVVPKILVV